MQEKHTTNSRAGTDAAVKKGFVNPACITIIPNGIDSVTLGKAACLESRWKLRLEWGLTDSQIAVVSVANIHPAKGHEDIVLAATELEDDNVHFITMGDNRSGGHVS